eukprot:TRINITY_DN4540_c0_g2_i8.p1 TRINITY_DN4540_c0_g2~~TRINITY_DN4540_c0_g2_i8.p1  ORF type:complete len:297 (+),score=40.26 TRINITY_DN4540_c0_g2_i8:64-954(+)
MKIGLFHGYELTGSGSNEFTRYLSRALTRLGHEVHVYCREPNADKVSHITDAYTYDTEGNISEKFTNRQVPDLPQGSGTCTVHELPHIDIRPVYLCDKQRVGNVKAFTDLTDAELKRYEDTAVRCVQAGLERFPVEVFHANHMVYQPMIARRACQATNTKWIIYPHGSSIEYTLRADDRFLQLARETVELCDGLIIGNHEVRDRVITLYPDLKNTILNKCRIVGVGVDTTLFAPVKKAERQAQSPMLARRGPFKGRESSVKDLLYKDLSTGNLDALPTYKSKYNACKYLSLLQPCR